MFALVDANSFYASAEKVFDPSIRQRPVVVLTNNDGCICALCDQAKQIGVKKFGPYYQSKALLAKHNAVIRSSNYELYDDLSNKMMEIIGRFAPRQHVYSIDECFLDFGQWQPPQGWSAYARQIKDQVMQELRLPVSVGIAATPTLAKAASFAAKRRRSGRGAACLVAPAVVEQVLSQMAVDDVWGVGKRLAKRLQAMGINHAQALADASPRQLRKHFSVELERTIRELNGTVCFDWETLPAHKKQVFSTRAFGQPLTALADLRQALAWHAERLAAKLRHDGLGVNGLTLFAHANPFTEQQPYHKSVHHSFTEPTNDTLLIARAIAGHADSLYKAGVKFHKCGVGAVSVATMAGRQADLFSPQQANEELMRCMDQINARYGKNTLGIAAKGCVAEGQPAAWAMRRAHLSPRFTTQWKDIPKISC